MWLTRFFRKRLRSRDFYAALFMLAFSLAMFFWLIPRYVSQTSYTSVVGPAFFPYFVTVGLAMLSIVLFCVSPQTSKEATRIEDKRLSRGTFLCIALLATYYFSIKLIGMIPASGLALFTLIRMFGYKHLSSNILFVVLFVSFLFIIFAKVLQVPLPWGTFFES